jgi:protein-S-isoprenylcysteine O-methyltransferase Ste14
MMTAFIALRAAVFAAAFLGFWLWVIVRLQPLSRSLDEALPPWLVGPGVAMIVLGVLGVIACIAVFVVRGRGTPAIFDAPRKFVATGPYRYVRNPMYLGAMLIFCGSGLSLRSVAVLGFSAAWFLLIHTFVVLIEEPGLHDRFGATYDDYRATVARWWPRRAVRLSERAVGR